MSIESAPGGFSTLGLSPGSLSAIARLGFTVPTPIQLAAIPPVLRGDDVIGCAATGTGKTLAFGLPMVERLGGKHGVRGLILAPTRELANQISDALLTFAAGKGLKLATLIGGVGMGGQLHAVRGGAQIIVATPGRLIDHLEQGTVKLDAVEMLVLDEADRMLDMGFKPQLTRILARVPRVRQTLLFSATMAGEVADFARANLQKPVRVEVTKSGTTAPRATQAVYLVSQTEKTALLQALLAGGEESTLVFTRTKRRADKVARQLEKSGLRVARIHADRSQSQREAALEGFRSGKFRVLVATDIAARGIDVAEIGHVVNYDLPHVPEDYVHRIGRTARAAASGHASSFASPEEQPLLKDIERFTRIPIPRGTVPREDPEFARAMAAAPAVMPHASRPQRHQQRQGRVGQGQGPGPRRSAPRHASSGAGSGSGRTLFSGGPRKR